MSKKTVQKEKQVLSNVEFCRMVRDHQKWLNNPRTGARAVFKDVIIKNVKIDSCNLCSSVFDNVLFDHVYFHTIELRSSKFINATAVSSTFLDCYFAAAIFTNVDFSNTDFSRSNLVRAVFTNVDFSNAVFGIYVSLRCTKCLNVNFSNAELCQTSMTEASIKNSIFDKSNMTHMILTGSKIMSSYLRGADLRYAYVSDTELKYCNITNALLNKDRWGCIERCVDDDTDADVLLLSPVSLITKLGRFSISVLRSLLMVCVCLIDLVFPVTFTYLIGKSMLKLVWFILALPSMFCDLFRRERDSGYMRDYPVHREKY
jgi:uncharacterized protein YjbI with pentapeptide repeats